MHIRSSWLFVVIAVFSISSTVTSQTSKSNALPKPSKKALKACAALKGVSTDFPRLPSLDKYAISPIVRFDVMENGEVSHVVLERSSGSPEADAALIEGIRQWKYKPQPGCGTRGSLMSVAINLSTQSIP